MLYLLHTQQTLVRSSLVPDNALLIISDDRTMHELYLWPFAEAVKVGVGATMTAYNRVGLSNASHSP